MRRRRRVGLSRVGRSRVRIDGSLSRLPARPLRNIAMDRSSFCNPPHRRYKYPPVNLQHDRLTSFSESAMPSTMSAPKDDDFIRTATKVALVAVSVAAAAYLLSVLRAVYLHCSSSEARRKCDWHAIDSSADHVRRFWLMQSLRWKLYYPEMTFDSDLLVNAAVSSEENDSIRSILGRLADPVIAGKDVWWRCPENFETPGVSDLS